MSLKEKILESAKKTAGAAGKQAMAGFDRLDELGGDFRDYLLKQDNPRLRSFGERLAKIGGVRLEDDETTAAKKRDADLVAAAASAPPPTAAQVAEAESKKGLGDPEIAAQVYGRKSCPWTGRAITLLNEGKVDYDFVELDDSENTHFEGKLSAETKQETVPYVFLRGEFVGGFNELNEVVRLGQLEARTLGGAEREAAIADGKIIDIAARR